LFDAFDSIDLMSIQEASAVDAAVKKLGRVQAMADRIHAELTRLLPDKTCAPTAARNRTALSDDQNVVDFPIGNSAPALRPIQDLPPQIGSANRQRP